MPSFLIWRQQTENFERAFAPFGVDRFAAIFGFSRSVGMMPAGRFSFAGGPPPAGATPPAAATAGPAAAYRREVLRCPAVADYDSGVVSFFVFTKGAKRWE